MSLVWIRVTNVIAGGLRTEPSNAPFILNLRDLQQARHRRVEVSAAGDRVTAAALIDASDALFQALQVTPSEGSLVLGLESEVLAAIGSLSAASHQVLRLIQQETEDYSLLPHNELLGIAGGFQWSSDGSRWNQLPLHGGSVAMSLHALGTLNSRLLRGIQTFLDNDERPLLAYEHLYHAERSDGLRFKWIEATTAAELAIKEVLIRITPTIRPLLEELPSPPLRKLYGPILEAYAGERSPYLSVLAQGAERRNQLIHQPEDLWLDHQEVLDYIVNVRSAIRHLLELYRRLRDNKSAHPEGPAPTASGPPQASEFGSA